MYTYFLKQIVIISFIIQIIDQPINYHYLQTINHQTLAQPSIFSNILYVRKTERKRDDVVRMSVEPYLENIFKVFSTKFNKHVKIYIVKKELDKHIDLYMEYEKYDTHIEVYMSEKFEQLLSYMYWDLTVSDNKKPVRKMIQQMILLYINKMQDAPNYQIDIEKFLKEHKNIPLDLKLWLNPLYQAKIYENPFDFNNQKSIGIQLLQVPYIVKRERAQDDIPDRKTQKFILDNFSTKVIKQLNMLRVIVKKNILILKTQILQTLGYTVVERGKKNSQQNEDIKHWSQKELETVFAQYNSLPISVREKAKLKVLVREPEDGRAQAQYISAIAEIAFRNSGSASHLLSIIHEFAHSLQTGTIKNLRKKWNKCRYKDRCFPSTYALTRWDEDMSDAVALYVVDPLKLLLACPHRYAFLKNLFKQKEYTNDVITNYAHKGVTYAIQTQNITLMDYFLKKKIVTRQELQDNYIWMNGTNRYKNNLVVESFTKDISLDSVWAEWVKKKLPSLWDALYYAPTSIEGTVFANVKDVSFEHNVGGIDERVPTAMIFVARGNRKGLKLFLDSLSPQQRKKVFSLEDSNGNRTTLYKQALYDGNDEILDLITGYMLDENMISPANFLQELQYGKTNTLTYLSAHHDIFYKILLSRDTNNGILFFHQIIGRTKSPQVVKAVLKTIGNDEKLLRAALLPSKESDWNAVKVAAKVAKNEDIIKLIFEAVKNNKSLHSAIFDETTMESIRELEKEKGIDIKLETEKSNTQKFKSVKKLKLVPDINKSHAMDSAV
jgi:hypothetical protein